MDRRRRAAALAPLACTLALGIHGVLAWPLHAADAPAPAAPPPAVVLPDHAKEEGKALLGLLRGALKDDFRRQAWWLATRLEVVDSSSAEAKTTRTRWGPTELSQGRAPDKSWLAERDSTLHKLGDLYAQHAQEMLASGASADAVRPFLERALEYGTSGKDAVPADHVWVGTWGLVSREALVRALGDRLELVSYPSAHDDEILEVSAQWPQARVARVRDWRLFTTSDLPEAGRLLTLLAAQEADFVRRFGSKAKAPRADEDAAIDLVLVPDAETYDRLAPLLFPQGRRMARSFEGTSGWYSPWSHRMLVMVRDRDNPWTPVDANLLAFASRGLARRHLGADAGGWTSGRGSWILDGLAGYYEGFHLTASGSGDLDPARSWHLAAAKALRAQLLPWAKLLELDRAQADQVSDVDVEIDVAGEKHAGRKVDLVTSQATALLVGILRLDPKAGEKKLAALLQETYKRDRMPDLDKALGKSLKQVIQAALDALDLVK